MGPLQNMNTKEVSEFHQMLVRTAFSELRQQPHFGSQIIVSEQSSKST
jgi:glucose dehydrogenase